MTRGRRRRTGGSDDPPASEPPSWLLLHGIPLSPAIWAGLLPGLGDAGPVFRPDLRVAPRDVSGEGLQTDLARAVLAALPDRPVRLVGHSFGGQVAVDLALLAPERVASMTLLCTRDSPFPAFAEAAAALRAGAAPDLPAAMRRWFTPAQLDADGTVVRSTRRCLADADPLVWAAGLDAIAAFDRTGRVGELDLPVTVVAARDDQISTPDVMADMARRMRSATFHLLPGSHMAPFTDPAVVLPFIVGQDETD